jgi:uncharacterized protein YdaU (DUF1376 family)
MSDAKKKRVDIWMPMFWSDYRGDTSHLGAAEHGAYLLLIGHYWTTGKPLPDDDNVLWRIASANGLAEWRKLRRKVAPFFQIHEGEWRHRRIDSELEKANEHKRKATNKARQAATARWEAEEQSKRDAPSNASSISKTMLEQCPPPPPPPPQALGNAPTGRSPEEPSSPAAARATAPDGGPHAHDGGVVSLVDRIAAARTVTA